MPEQTHLIASTELGEFESSLSGDLLFAEAQNIRREAGVDDSQWEKACEVLSRLKDHHQPTYAHSLYVGRGTWGLAAHKENYDDLAYAYLAGLLHDTGKLFVDRELLDLDGPLSEPQKATMRQHSSIGFYFLRDKLFDDEISLVAAWHHLFPPEGEEHGYGIPVDSDEVEKLTAYRPWVKDRAIWMSKLVQLTDCIDAALTRTDRLDDLRGIPGHTNLEHQRRRFVNDSDRINWLLERHIVGVS